MDAGRNTWFTKKALDIVVGIEVGVIGGFAMLALMIFIAPLLGQSWWTYPNLFASHYYSRAVVSYAPGLATVSGIGLQVFWAGIIGALAGFLSPRGRAAMTVAMFWFLACYFVIWRKYAPGIATYGSGALLFASFLLYGSVLRLQPKFLARVRPPERVPLVVTLPPVDGSGSQGPLPPAPMADTGGQLSVSDGEARVPLSDVDQPGPDVHDRITEEHSSRPNGNPRPVD